MKWLDDDLGLKSVEDRTKLLQNIAAEKPHDFQKITIASRLSSTVMAMAKQTFLKFMRMVSIVFPQELQQAFLFVEIKLGSLASQTFGYCKTQKPRQSRLKNFFAQWLRCSYCLHWPRLTWPYHGDGWKDLF